MWFRRGKEKIKKIDVLITSVVLGTIIAGAFGLKKKDTAPLSFWKRLIKHLIGK